jgi:hypothetical protein
MHPRRSSSARGVALLVVAAAANVALAGCATSSEPANVHVKNDTADIVTLAVCGSKDCSRRLDPWHLRPGASGAVNVEINGGYGPAIVIRSDGSAVGCLPFRMAKRPPQGFSVTVSQAVACGRSGGVAAANGKDWPDPSL